MVKRSALESDVKQRSHIILLLLISVAAFISSCSFGYAMKGFGDHCMLYAKLNFSDLNDTFAQPVIRRYQPENISVKPINAANTVWGQIRLCNFCQFTPIISMVSGIIWFSMFAICPRGGAAYSTEMYSRPWVIVFPATLFSLCAAIIMLVSSIELSGGLASFCAQFRDVLHTETCTSHIDVYTRFFNFQEINFSLAATIATSTSYTCCGLWFVHLTLLILRILYIPDFQMIQISIVKRFIKSSSKNGDKVEKLITLSPDKSNNSVNGNLYNDNKEKFVPKTHSYKDQRSPSFNFVDDSPLNSENSKQFSLVAMNGLLVDVTPTTNYEEETPFQAPRANLNSKRELKPIVKYINENAQSSSKAKSGNYIRSRINILKARMFGRLDKINLKQRRVTKKDVNTPKSDESDGDDRSQSSETSMSKTNVFSTVEVSNSLTDQFKTETDLPSTPHDQP
ncbi:hypothetical protein FQA39_LY08076 [Lamprigera yunnana]|nr:hypothetical protein FQA39_LY08076 [Lamprigera yunnana]